MLRCLKKWASTASETLSRRKPAGGSSSLHRVVRRRFEPLESRQMLALGPVVINEFLAANDNGLADGDGDASD